MQQIAKIVVTMYPSLSDSILNNYSTEMRYRERGAPEFCGKNPQTLVGAGGGGEADDMD